MNTRELIKIVYKYCDSIRLNGKHYVCYPKGLTRIIVISASPSDRNSHKQVYREFRRFGIIIKELEK